MKSCFKCFTTKPIDCFYKHAAMKDGRLNKCIECTKKDVLLHRQENLEKIRSYDKFRGSMPHRVAARLEYQKTIAYAQSHKASTAKWLAKHPERRMASTALGNAIKGGRIQKYPCMVCGEERVQGHHPDYSKPLEVVWLCVTHHSEIHHQTIK